MKNIDVSIIIVNYKTEKLLIDTINSVCLKTTNITYEIIVVDNNSNDNSDELIKNLFNSQISYLSLPSNLGFGRANNVGANNALGKYLFFLNSDTILINNAVEILFEFMEKEKNVGICGGNLFSADFKPVHSCMPVLPSLFLEIDSIFGHLFLIMIYGKRFDFNTSKVPKKVADIIGADLMIRSDIFHECGGFDPDFFLYNEESELSFRVQQKGFEVYCISDAKIIHLEGKSSSSDISRRKYALISRKIFFKKLHGVAYRFLVDIVFALKCVLGILFSIFKFDRMYLNYWIYALKNGMIELW